MHSRLVAVVGPVLCFDCLVSSNTSCEYTCVCIRENALLTHQVSNVHDVGSLDGCDGMPCSCRLVQDFQPPHFGLLARIRAIINDAWTPLHTGIL